MGLENKRFKVKGGDTAYTLETSSTEDFYRIKWTTDVGGRETDEYRRDIVEEKLTRGDWYIV